MLTVGVLAVLIPQTVLTVGVLAVLIRSAHDSGDDAETLPGSRETCKLRYKMDLTLKNTS